MSHTHSWSLSHAFGSLLLCRNLGIDSSYILHHTHPHRCWQSKFPTEKLLISVSILHCADPGGACRSEHVTGDQISPQSCHNNWLHKLADCNNKESLLYVCWPNQHVLLTCQTRQLGQWIHTSPSSIRFEWAGSYHQVAISRLAVSDHRYATTFWLWEWSWLTITSTHTAWSYDAKSEALPHKSCQEWSPPPPQTHLKFSWVSLAARSHHTLSALINIVFMGSIFISQL